MIETFDEAAKAIYRGLFLSWGIQVETECQVYKRARSIDLVIDCTLEDPRAEPSAGTWSPTTRSA